MESEEQAACSARKLRRHTSKPTLLSVVSGFSLVMLAPITTALAGGGGGGGGVVPNPPRLVSGNLGIGSPTPGFTTLRPRLTLSMSGTSLSPSKPPEGSRQGAHEARRSNSPPGQQATGQFDGQQSSFEADVDDAQRATPHGHRPSRKRAPELPIPPRLPACSNCANTRVVRSGTAVGSPSASELPPVGDPRVINTVFVPPPPSTAGGMPGHARPSSVPSTSGTAPILLVHRAAAARSSATAILRDPTGRVLASAELPPAGIAAFVLPRELAEAQLELDMPECGLVGLTVRAGVAVAITGH